ncbi:hypothetical protein HI914_07153 [Erysiphe necator]|nr:hypothetical protein HI914_07153 [Erysiphe necator]
MVQNTFNITINAHGSSVNPLFPSFHLHNTIDHYNKLNWKTGQFSSQNPLPELTYVFEANQRQGRACNACIKALVNFLSYIDGTVANFQDDEDNEIAITIKLHLHSGLKNLTVLENSSNSLLLPSPHIIGQIKMHSHPKVRGQHRIVTVASPLTHQINSKTEEPYADGIILPHNLQ